jgi:hypothetical protein
MPQAAEAIAMAKPEVMATQFVGSAAVVAPVCANAAGAMNASASSANRIIEYFFIVFLLRYEIAARRWFPDIPLAAGLTRDSGSCRYKITF